MLRRIDLQRLAEIWRYYQAGAVNALFGFGMYSLFVWLGVGIFAAQILAHVLGVAFNYFTYSRHTFRDAGPAKLRFVMSYGLNYLVSVGALLLASSQISSPYIAGLIAIILTSIVNYFLLRYLVFVRRAAR